MAFARLSSLNTWIADKFHTTKKRVFQIEIGGLAAFGYTQMQIGEWAAAVFCWFALGFILLLKALAWDGIREQSGLTIFLRSAMSFGAIMVSVLLVTITVEHKPDNEPWSNLQKLLQHKPSKPFNENDLSAAVHTSDGSPFSNTVITVKNGSDYKIGKHKIWCDVKKVNFLDTRVIYQGNSSSTTHPWNNTPLLPGGDAQSDNCILVAPIGSPVLCADVVVSFDYVLDGYSQEQKTKQFRFVGFGPQLYWEWNQQPLSYKDSFCG